MAKHMLIDAAHPEETRVVVLNGNRLEEFDFESSTKKQVKGNIYLAKVTRVEPSLQAAFVDYGGNRHGFLAFSEIHPDYYRIPVSDRPSEEREPVERDAGAREPTAAGPSEGEAAEFDAPPTGVMTVVPDLAVPETLGEAMAAAEPDETAIAIADALPVAAPVPPAAEDEEEEEAEVESETAVANATEAVGETEAESETGAETAEPGPGSAEEDRGAEEAATGSAGDDRDAALVASGDSVVSGDPFDASGIETVATAEEVETLDDDEAEDAGEQRRRWHSMRHYKIQEVIKRRQIMLVQVAKEERGNKGAALTTYLSLAGRYCVLMPNTARGGGVSRKITSLSDRRRLKKILEELEIPEGMGVIVRTAGAERSKAEIKRDYEYLMRLWSEIRDLTLKSTAPSLIHEEGNLIKRSIRDLYARDIDEVIVEGEEGYKTAKAFMRMLTPSHARRVQHYRDPQISLFHRYQVESQIDAAHSPIAQLRSGGYVVINQTEALVAIDVNSGRATRERNIEETALRTNLEASDEIARQLRLRDLAGLIVIDFIDMEEHRHNSAVERRLKEALKNDRARIQVGRISPFGLMEMSRQRLRPSLTEASSLPCPHCGGSGFVRSTESTALYVLRSIEEEGARARSAEICVYVPTAVALYVLNQKRESLAQIEARYGFKVIIGQDDSLTPPNFRLERLRAFAAGEAPAPRPAALLAPEVEEEDDEEEEVAAQEAPLRAAEDGEGHSRESGTREHDDERGGRRRRRRRGRRENGREPRQGDEGREPRRAEAAEGAGFENGEDPGEEALHQASAEGGDRRRRRRGRRGGRWRDREGASAENGTAEGMPAGEAAATATAEAIVEAAIEGAEIPPAEIAEPAMASPETEPEPAAPAPQPAETEAQAMERAEIPVTEPEPVIVEPAPVEPVAEPERELEPLMADGGPAARSEPAPSSVDVHAVTETPAAPRRGWWQRLTQP